MKNFIKKGSMVLIIFLVLILALITVNTIPKKYIKDNVKESLEVLKIEGHCPPAKWAYRLLLDNYTDAIMLDTAYSMDTNNLIESTMFMRRGYRTNANLTLNSIDVPDVPINNLEANISETNTSYYEYFRYWHGYMIFLRPLLVFFNYSEIRVILVLVITLLAILLVFFTYKKVDKTLALATILMLLASNFWAIGLSMQYVAVFVITLLSSIYIVGRKDKKTDGVMLFLVIGMLTSFFDLFTTPILTLGIPMIFWIYTKNKEKNTLKGSINILLAWGTGYSFAWLSKWILMDAFYGVGAIKDAIDKVLLYTVSNKEVTASIIKIIITNIYCIELPLVICIGALTASFIYKLCVVKTKIDKSIYQYILISLSPFVWYFLVKNHSYIHAGFTYRLLLITIFSLSVVITKNICKKIKSKRENKIDI